MPRFQTISPTDGSVLANHTTPDNTELAQTVSHAKAAQTPWAATSLKQRARVLTKVAKALEAAGDDLVAHVRQETGKPVSEIWLTDMSMVVGSFAQAARMGLKALSPQSLGGPESMRSTLMGRTHQRVANPWGVVAVISPWNYPLATPGWGIAAALMAGNAVILKPSELTPACGEALIQVIQTVLAQHNLPKTLVQCVVGDGQTGEQLLAQAIDAVVFTGSTAVGRHIQAQMALHNIPVSLELGGSCPMVVLPTGLRTAQQLDAITSQATWARCVNAGQSCAAVKRLLVPVSRHEAVVNQLINKMSQLTFDTPEQPGHIGPMISTDQRFRLHRQVQRAVDDGGHITTGGELSELPGAYYPPTLITHLPASANVLQEEWFGPVLIVQAYTSVEEAITLANATPYGLTASVFGEPREARPVAEKLDAGLVSINDVALTHYGWLHVPWQGIKASGPGVAHSMASLQNMAQWKTIGTNHVSVFKKMPWLFGNTCTHQDDGLGRGLTSWMATPWWRFDKLLGATTSMLGRLNSRL